MAEPSKRERGRKARQPLWKKGLMATLAGFGLLGLGAVVGGKHPAVATAVSMPAWWALGLGAFWMALHLATRLPFKRRASRRATPDHPSFSSSPPPSPSPSLSPTRRDTDALKALIDQIEGETLGSDTAWTAQPPRHSAADSPAGAWDASALARLDPRQLAALCEALFAQAGFTTRAEPHGDGSAVDIWLHLPDELDAVALVHCHADPEAPLDATDVRALQHRISHHQLRWGVGISLAEATTPAITQAGAYGIHLLDAHDLGQLIDRRPPAQQAALRAVVARPSQA